MQSGENFAHGTFSAAPVNKADQRHQKERLGIPGDEKESGRMRGNRERSKKAQCRREFPAIAKKKEIAPKSPGGELRRNEQSSFGVDLKNVTNQTRQRRISGKEGDVGHFHHLVIDRGNRCLVAAINDVGEPIAVVLNETLVAVGKRPFRR